LSLSDQKFPPAALLDADVDFSPEPGKVSDRRPEGKDNHDAESGVCPAHHPWMMNTDHQK